MFERRVALAKGSRDDDVFGLRVSDIDTPIVRPCRGDEAQVGKPIQQRCIEFRALSHGANDRVGFQPLGKDIFVGSCVREGVYEKAILYARPVCEFERYILIIIEDGNANALGGHVCH